MIWTGHLSKACPGMLEAREDMFLVHKYLQLLWARPSFRSALTGDKPAGSDKHLPLPQDALEAAQKAGLKSVKNVVCRPPNNLFKDVWRLFKGLKIFSMFFQNLLNSPLRLWTFEGLF